MARPSKFSINAEPLKNALKKAINEEHSSLSDIANRAGLSVPTISRIYSEDDGIVQAKTARRLAEALGYTVEITKNGNLKMEREAEKPHFGRLTSAQKAKLLRAFEKLLNEF